MGQKYFQNLTYDQDITSWLYLRTVDTLLYVCDPRSASKIFQKVIHDQIKHIRGALKISDDVIIYGKSQNEHDAALHAVCQRFMNQNKLTFFGLVFSSDGISADPAKVSAIKNAPAPRCAKDIRSFLGMATYCAKFIPNFSDLKAVFHFKRNIP